MRMNEGLTRCRPGKHLLSRQRLLVSLIKSGSIQADASTRGTFVPEISENSLLEISAYILYYIVGFIFSLPTRGTLFARASFSPSK